MPAYVTAVLNEIAALEVQCGELDQTIGNADWVSTGNVLRAMRRTTHALENAMAAQGVADTPGFLDHVHARIARVHAYRASQLEQLEAVRNGLSERLRSISRFKGYGRAIGAKPATPQPRAVDSLR